MVPVSTKCIICYNFLMKNYKISVVINVYNLAIEYVKRSVGSIIHQQYDNFECIIVDDGSEEKFKHTKYYENIILDKRFKYIYQKNIGPGPSRSVGINAASGDYVMFLDGDDYYDVDALSFINESFNKYDADVLHFNYNIITDKTLKPVAAKTDILKFKLNNKDNIKLSDFKQIQGNKFVLKLNFLRNNNILCYEKNILHEDVYFCLLFKTLMKNIIFSENEIYFYDTTRSTSFSNNDIKNNYITFIDNIELVYNHLKDNDMFNEMFLLYVVYYLNKFIGTKYKKTFGDILFMNNLFLKNKIGIEKYHTFLWIAYKHITIGKIINIILNNKNIMKFLKKILIK